MSTLIQTRLHYVFIDEKLLNSALRSAHREKNDDVLDDGNRGLAHYGNLAIQLARTHDAIIDNGKTLHDIHAQNHWSKTKKSRAKACKLLGLEPLITRSVRQQHEPSSDTVLDHALSAVLGAIWLDCERQEHKISHIRSTMLEILRIIDAIVDQTVAPAGCATDIDESPNLQSNLTLHPPEWHPRTLEMNHGDLDDVEYFTREWLQQELGCCSLRSILDHDSHPELQPFVDHNGRTASLDNQSVHSIDPLGPATSFCNENCADESRYEIQSSWRFNPLMEQSSFSTSQTTRSDAAKSAKAVKRKRCENEYERFHCLYLKMLQAEQKKLLQYPQSDQESMNRFLEHPLLDKLEKRGAILARFLYLTIGSWETVVDFKHLIELSKGNTRGLRRPYLLSNNAAAMYDEICRLENEEALCVLLRRYYTIKFCEEEQLYNDNHGHIIVETPNTVNHGRLAKPGNPVYALDSSLTERLLLKIMPDADRESTEFHKARVKIKRLRRLAGRLHHFVKRYGYGILGLLPSGPSFEQMLFTDNMCVNAEITSRM
ncbi:hypothetical protein SVAN01_11069 [Stagonosporopsis vannaccii]|nr:hypothetical protein SVAN01_11069 [Stagonosporopsis vannaccii]